MKNYEESFKVVTEDIFNAINNLEYKDMDDNCMKVNILFNLNKLFSSYESYKVAIDTLMNDNEIHKQKSLRKEL